MSLGSCEVCRLENMFDQSWLYNGSILEVVIYTWVCKDCALFNGLKNIQETQEMRFYLLEVICI